MKSQTTKEETGKEKEKGKDAGENRPKQWERRGGRKTQQRRGKKVFRTSSGSTTVSGDFVPLKSLFNPNTMIEILSSTPAS